MDLRKINIFFYTLTFKKKFQTEVDLYISTMENISA